MKQAAHSNQMIVEWVVSLIIKLALQINLILSQVLKYKIKQELLIRERKQRAFILSNGI